MDKKLFNIGETGVFKITFPTGETAYTQTKQTFNIESTLSKCTKTAEACIKRDKPTNVYNKLVEFKGQVSVEFMGSRNSSAEATSFKRSLISSDVKSIDRGSSNNRIGGSNSVVRVSKKNTVSIGNDIFISALSKDSYKLLKGKVSTHNNVNIPGKGRFFKITANNISLI